MIAIFVDGTNDHYTRGYNFPIGTTPKKFSVSELGVIFWGSPLFLAVFGHSHVRGATTLNFGPGSGVLGRFGNWLAAATDLGTGSVEVEVLVSTEPAFTVGPLRVELVELFARSLEAKAGCWDTS